MATKKPQESETSCITEEDQETLKNVIDRNEPKTDEDLILLLTHTVLLQNGFKIACIGRSEDGDATQGPSLEGTALPDGWNKQSDPDCYEFTYKNVEKQTPFILRALLIEDKLCLNFIEAGKSHASATEAQIFVNDHVTMKTKPPNFGWLNDPGFLWKVIERGLLGKHQDLLERRGEEMHMKLIEQERPRPAERVSQSVLHDGIPVQQPHIFSNPNSFQRPSPFAYGDADRLPGHPGMGGMTMDPFRSGGMGLRPPGFPGIPRGSVPPGARFDPFGPLTEFDYSSGDRRPPRSFDPNPDHLQRPGFNDDMFM